MVLKEHRLIFYIFERIRWYKQKNLH